MRTPYHEEEAAAFLGLKKQTLANWRHLRRGPAYHKLSEGPRGRVVYYVEDLQVYLDRCRIDPEAA